MLPKKIGHVWAGMSWVSWSSHDSLSIDCKIGFAWIFDILLASAEWRICSRFCWSSLKDREEGTQREDFPKTSWRRENNNNHNSSSILFLLSIYHAAFDNQNFLSESDKSCDVSTVKYYCAPLLHEHPASCKNIAEDWLKQQEMSGSSSELSLEIVSEWIRKTHLASREFVPVERKWRHATFSCCDEWTPVGRWSTHNKVVKKRWQTSCYCLCFSKLEKVANR